MIRDVNKLPKTTEINKAIKKKDSEALLTGKPVYTNDLAPEDCLVLKILRSPYPHAIVKEINTKIAEKFPGVECILTHENVPKTRFTIAGQTYPEFSPYDRLILDKHLRFAGDAVAIVAAVDEKTANKALKAIKVKYEKLEPLLDFHKAKDNEIVVHPESDWLSMVDCHGDVKRNLVAEDHETHGDMEKVLSECDVVIDETYHTGQAQQSMMETFRSYAYPDAYGRITIVSSTQVPFHVRRNVARALEIPKSQVRVIKPRIGGGFGAKQTCVSEIYPAYVAKITGKPAKLLYTREETLIASSPRHESDVRIRIGAMKDGKIRAIELSSLWNAGAYGEHSTTTVTLSGHKNLPLYGNLEAFGFHYEVVYTNTLAAGAYRGYGATQGNFALESAINLLAEKLNMDVAELQAKNILKEGQLMPAYFNETANSCALDRCLEHVMEMSDWKNKPRKRIMPNGKIRGTGMAVAMQGSSISHVDTASVTIKVNDDGFYTMNIGATDMGTGCDTILAQIAAECLECSADNIIVHGVDTDLSPYDSGSYASSTTYLTGMAVVKTCESLIKLIRETAAKKLGCSFEETEFTGKGVICTNNDKFISLIDLSYAAQCGAIAPLHATEAHHSPVSPPPYMAAVAEVEIDPETGKIELVQYDAVVDCGTVINPALAKVQVEGGLVQGIGMALTEDPAYNSTGHLKHKNFMQYKLPVRSEVMNINVDFESSYEPMGPFGAKSIGEIVINTPAPAIANAVYAATGYMAHDLRIKPENVYWAMHEKD